MRPAAHNGQPAAARNQARVAASLVYSADHLRRPESPAATFGVPTSTPGRRISLLRSDGHQTDLPTQEEVPAQDPRVSHPDVDTRWTPGAQGAASQGPQAPDPRAHAVTSRHRLRGRRRFAATRASGLRASAAGVRVHVAGNGLDVARVGFALVGLRSSVRRNLLRRRLRDVVRPLLGRLAGHDIVIVAGTDASKLRFGDLRAAVDTSTARALQRAESAAMASTTDNGVMPLVPERPR
jgi:ribonuclease P protein component